MHILYIIAAFIVVCLLVMLRLETRGSHTNDKWPADIDRFNEEEES